MLSISKFRLFLLRKVTFIILFFVFCHNVIAENLTYILKDIKLFSHADYDYAPSAFIEKNKIKMFWCGSRGSGDMIFFSETPKNKFNWSRPISLFKGGGGKAFDGLHTCDPSVIVVDSTYYLYYGGLSSEPGANKKCQTKIGVASSLDGRNWTRLNDGKAIVYPDGKCTKNQYGVGQPSVLFLDGYFYMLYTDTAGFSSNPNNGAGLYLIRSKTPVFSGREVFSSTGWKIVSSLSPTTNHKFIDGFSSEFMYSTSLKRFFLALHYDQGKTIIKSYNRDFIYLSDDIEVVGKWRDGPGFIRSAKGYSINSNCNNLREVLIRARGDGGVGSWELFLTEFQVFFDDKQCD